MNKKTVIPFLAATVLGSAILGANLYSSAASNHTQSKSIEVSDHETNDDNLAELQAKAKLTSDEAKVIALKKVPGTVKDSELEDEDGVVVYSFEIHNAKGEASDVKVNAENGQIVKVEKGDQDGKDKETDGETNDDNLAELQAKAKLTSDEAKVIALKKVPGKVKDSELEDEDGVVVYSFEIHNAKGEASDVKVNAENGQIVKVEKGDQDGKDNETDGETNDDNLAELQAKAKLTTDEAKSIALKKVAGTVEKSDIEDEDGIVVYGFEIQAKNGEVKDVKVNAQSGKVLKVESDNQEKGQEQND